MEETLASPWNSFSLSESETTTLIIDQTKLSIPANAIIRKLAMKKFVSLFEIERGLKTIWNVNLALETTRLSDDVFMFAFNDRKIYERIVDNQPWNYKGSLVLLDHVHGEECPSDFSP